MEKPTACLDTVYDCTYLKHFI